MNPISFKEVNKLFGAGDNPNTDQLPVCIATHDANQGLPSVISKWKLSPEEIQRLVETGELYLMVMGTSLPPMCVTVLNPFTEEGYKPVEL